MKNIKFEDMQISTEMKNVVKVVVKESKEKYKKTRSYRTPITALLSNREEDGTIEVGGMDLDTVPQCAIPEIIQATIDQCNVCEVAIVAEGSMVDSSDMTPEEDKADRKKYPDISLNPRAFHCFTIKLDTKDYIYIGIARFNLSKKEGKRQLLGMQWKQAEEDGTTEVFNFGE
ncbi:MAG TPA: hypothetical protein VM577_03635 [Anaerovoracaceae bacterium]|nr:hypothetical protein [Anaerovoracaceae bacterium]